MTKRNLASYSGPDVRYETDEDGTKLIIRKFDMPLPTRSSAQPSILRSKSIFGPLTVGAPKEKWKYQHDVPEGKIYTRRVHELNPKPQTSPKSNDVLSPILPSPISKVLPSTVQNVQMSLSKAPGRKDIIVMAPKEQSTKLLSTIPTVKGITQTVNNNVLRAEKITLNNLPDNVIANSIQLIDSKYVNGRKVVYLKAYKEVGRVDKSANNVTSETTPQSSAELKKVDTQAMRIVPSHGTVSGSNEINLGEIISDSSVQKTLLNVPGTQQTDSQTGAPISKLRSVLAQKLNVVTHDGKSMANIISMPSDSALQNSEFRMNKSLSVVTPIIVPHSGVQVSSKPMVSQTTCELKNSNMYFTGPVRASSNIFGCSSVASNVRNSSREITLQVNPTSKTDSHVLSIDSSKKSSTVLPKNNKNSVSYQVSGSSCNMPSVNNIHVDELPNVQESDLTYMPIDSTTPIILNTSSLTTSLNPNIDKTSTPEAILVMSQDGTTSLKDVINSNPKECSVQCEGSNIACGSETNIVIVNKLANNLNLGNSSKNVLPKQNINYDEIMHRRKIALQYQHDMQRNRGLPRIERTIELPARKVKVVEISTQTSLFCLLEPGRMVEMFLNNESEDSKISSLQSKHSLTCSNLEQMKNKNISKKEANMKGPNAMNCPSNSNTIHSSEISEKTGPSLPKRMRLEEEDSNTEILRQINGSNQNSESEFSILQAPMDFEDFMQPHIGGMEKENMIEPNNKKIPSKSQKNNELSFQSNNINNNNSLPLNCMLSAMNSSMNSNEVSDKSFSNIEPRISKEAMRKLFNDFRKSLVADEDGNLPIHNAVMDNDHKQVERQCIVLHGQKKSVNMKNIREETPLHLAVLCHDLKMVQLLLRYKAEIHLPDSAGNSALHMAIIWSNNIEILKVLLAAISDESNGNSVLDEPNDEGYSPLHLCALHNKIDEAVLLIKKNADVNVRDRKSGRTPLFHAVENANTEMYSMLINSGASTTIPNFSGQTPLNASEAVLDTVLSYPESSRISKPFIVPCSCQHNNALEHEMCSSKEEMMSSGNISDRYISYKSILQNR